MESDKVSSHQAPRSDAPVHLIRTEEALLPTAQGNFRIVAFTDEATGQDHLAVVSGEVQGQHGVLVRIHSECLTGDVLGSMRCDCGPQLDLALRRIAEQDGVLVYLRQEGRGIGLANKVRAYRLQDEGRDTVDANLELGLPSDARDYSLAAAILEELDVKCVRLMTNNPAKVDALEDAGIKVAVREPHEIPPNAVNRAYLETKRDRMDHALDLLEKPCPEKDPDDTAS
jgi:3,4-dihydroxy 2-butanone 4-phosphate synthase / GTP cyclohydrolase II